MNRVRRGTLRLVPALFVVALSGPVVARTPRSLRPRRVVSVHELFRSQTGVVVLMRRTEEGVAAGRIDPLPVPLTVWRYPEPLGDGTWVELLNRRSRNLGAYRAAVPEGPGWCGVELPLVPGTWWVLVIRLEDGENRILGRFLLGPKLARLAAAAGEKVGGGRPPSTPK